MEVLFFYLKKPIYLPTYSHDPCRDEGHEARGVAGGCEDDEAPVVPVGGGEELSGDRDAG
jgi:hypothetical protein